MTAGFTDPRGIAVAGSVGKIAKAQTAAPININRFIQVSPYGRAIAAKGNALRLIGFLAGPVDKSGCRPATPRVREDGGQSLQVAANPPTKSRLLLFVVEKRFEQALHLRGFDGVWLVAVDALIFARAFAAWRQHQFHRLSALRTNALVDRHRSNRTMKTLNSNSGG